MSVDRMQERLVRSVEVVRDKLLVVRHDTVVDVDGKEHLREVVAHRGGVAIVALTDDNRVVLIRQYRHAAGQVLLEIPAGTLDAKPDGSTEAHEDAAPRELGEETGYNAGDLRLLSEFYTGPGFTTELMHLYLGRHLTRIEGYEGPEADERLEVEEIPFTEALRMADDGEIRDGKTLVGLYRAARFLEAEG